MVLCRIGAGSLLLLVNPASLLQHRGHVSPELLPRRTLVLGQFRQGSGAPETREVAQGMVALEQIPYDRCPERSALHQFRPKNEIGPQPVHRLLAQACTFLVLKFSCIFALTT